MLRVRIVGSVEACATRISDQEGLSYAEAKRKVQDSNKRRGKFVWDLFHSRYNEPTSTWSSIPITSAASTTLSRELILMAVRARGSTASGRRRNR